MMSIQRAARFAAHPSADDRDSWSFDRSYRMLTYDFRVQTDVAEAAVLLDRYLERFRGLETRDAVTYRLTRSSNGEQKSYSVHLNEEEVWKSQNVPGLIDHVLWHSNQQAINAAESHIAIHASVASWQGRALVFPAPMNSGKTTLVAGLTRAGFSYLSDEAALISTRDGHVHPFPKTLWLEPPSIRAMPELQAKLDEPFRDLKRMRCYVLPEDLHPDPFGVAAPLGFVITPKYVQGSTTLLEQIGRPEGLITLTNNAFNLDRFASTGFKVLGEAIRDARCFTLRVGDLDSAVEAILDLMETDGGS